MPGLFGLFHPPQNIRKKRSSFATKAHFLGAMQSHEIVGSLPSRGQNRSPVSLDELMTPLIF